MYAAGAADATRYVGENLLVPNREANHTIALFLTTYTQLVFGVETAMRALRKDQPFAPRAKWAVTICLATIGLLCLINFLVANFDRSLNFCLLSLFWFVAHYSTGCFALLVGITSTLLVCTGIIFLKLTRSIKIEVTARVAASRMVYYMALAIISNVSFLEPPANDPRLHTPGFSHSLLLRHVFCRGQGGCLAAVHGCFRSR